MADTTPDPDEQQAPQSPSDAVTPQMTMHPITYPTASSTTMPMHMYTFPPGVMPAQPTRTKRRQVKNACTNCQKACKKCDDARPCLRCVKYGIAEDCIDSQRKERQKGIKRGPYKKRDGKTANVDSQEGDVVVQQQPGMGMTPPVASTAAPSSTPPVAQFVAAPVPYAPAGYGMYHPAQYAGPPPSKPGEGPPVYYQPVWIPTLAPPAPPTGPDGEAMGYAAPPGYFPTYFAAAPPPMSQPYPQYMMHAPRHDAQMQMAPPPHHYAPYPPPAMYAPKPPSRGPGGGELVMQPHPQMMDPRRDMRMEQQHPRMGEGMSSAHHTHPHGKPE